MILDDKHAALAPVGCIPQDVQFIRSIEESNWPAEQKLAIATNNFFQAANRCGQGSRIDARCCLHGVQQSNHITAQPKSGLSGTAPHYVRLSRLDQPKVSTKSYWNRCRRHSYRIYHDAETYGNELPVSCANHRALTRLVAFKRR